jgi:hypothetical protein
MDRAELFASLAETPGPSAAPWPVDQPWPVTHGAAVVDYRVSAGAGGVQALPRLCAARPVWTAR